MRYLIRTSAIRHRHGTSPLDMVSLSMRPLGELIDMYHTHQATDRRDKVYALLGMSSDDLSQASISPNYTVSWESLFERLIKFLLGPQVSVETWADTEMAAIHGRGYVLGKVSLVDKNTNPPERQTIQVTLRQEHKGLVNGRGCPTQENEALGCETWTLPPSAKSIEEGDLVCLVHGASKSIIIRPCMDHYDVILVAASLPRKRNYSFVTHNLSLIWDWSPATLPTRKPHEISMNSRLLENNAKTSLIGLSNEMARVSDVVSVIEELEGLAETAESLQKT